MYIPVFLEDLGIQNHQLLLYYPTLYIVSVVERCVLGTLPVHQIVLLLQWLH